MSLMAGGQSECRELVAFPADMEVLGVVLGAAHSSRATELCEGHASRDACSCGREGGELPRLLNTNPEQSKRI